MKYEGGYDTQLYMCRDPEVVGLILTIKDGRRQALHVEYAERGKDYGILFMFSLCCRLRPQASRYIPGSSP